MFELSVAMTVYIYCLAIISGLSIGSFLNCFAYRWVKGESVRKGRSHCALCGHDLKVADLVPILSWVMLRGKCRYCGGKLSPVHPLSEAILALGYVSALFCFGVSPEALKYAILLSLLFAASLTDIYDGRIPDRLTVIGAVSAFLFALLPASGETIPVSLLWTLISGLSISLPVLVIVLIMDKLLKKETMGGGDIKLMFLIGLYFDWKLNILILIIACVVGLCFIFLLRSKEERRGAFSFGPALAVSAWIVMLFGRHVVDWYLGLIM